MKIKEPTRMIIKRFSISVFLMGTLLIGQAVWAATYYVDRNLPGSDSNNGTSETTPFLTISKCASLMVAGDTCLVKNGTYAEVVTSVRSGTAGAPITFKNYPGHAPVLDGSNAIAIMICLNCNGGTPSQTISYVTIEGFEITGGINQGIKAINGDHLVFRHNYMHANGNPGPSEGNGILCRCVSTIIDSNHFSKNGIPTPPYGHGMYLVGHNYTVINNISDQNQGTGAQCAGYPFNSASMPDINYSGCTGLFANNTFAYSQQATGLVLWNNGIAPIVTVRNNIFYENGQLSSGDTQGIVIYPGVSAVITNNVSYATLPGRTGFISADNIANCVGCTISGNSTTTNPTMVNAPTTAPTSPDFHLAAGSVARGFGVNLTANGITTDFDGIARPASGAWDVGAYKFPTETTQVTAPQGLRVQ
jgi:hypothetical protein